MMRGYKASPNKKYFTLMFFSEVRKAFRSIFIKIKTRMAGGIR
jgi:hypothetical protein